MKPIQQYIDYREYLADYQAERQTRNASLSIRALLKKAGITSPSYFRQVVDGSRNLTEKTTEQLLSAMSLNEAESEYFREMVRFCHADSSENKQRCYLRLRELASQAKVRVVGEDSYAFYENWYTPVIRELICLKDFGEDYGRLARSLRPRIGASEAKKSVKLLLDLGFVKPCTGGGYEQSDSLLNTGFEVHSMAVRAFNKQMVGLARDALDAYPSQERHVTGITMGVSRKTYESIVEEIRALHERVLRLVEMDQDQERVYQLCTMVFPVGNPEDV